MISYFNLIKMIGEFKFSGIANVKDFSGKLLISMSQSNNKNVWLIHNPLVDPC